MIVTLEDILVRKTKKYEVIYADPPWQYKVWSGSGGAELHYKTMELSDIKSLPIKMLSAKDAALFLWVTMPTLDKAFEVIDSWGFVYKTAGFVWVKKNKNASTYFYGQGYWTRANAELCLLATKGSPKRVSCDVQQIVSTRIKEHSKKPVVVRERIVQLLGDVPRIELFAREAVDGWDIFGNEIPKYKERLEI